MPTYNTSTITEQHSQKLTLIPQAEFKIRIIVYDSQNHKQVGQNYIHSMN